MDAGAFQEAFRHGCLVVGLFGLGVLFLVAGGIWLCRQARRLHASCQGQPVLRRLSLMTLLVLAFTVGGTKTNNVNNLPPQQMAPLQLPPVPRPSPSMSLPLRSPPAAGFEPIASWTRTGAYSNEFVIDFPEGWCFPYETNHLASVALVARGEVFPSEQAEDPLAALTTLLSIKPGNSEVVHGLTTNNSYRIEWHACSRSRMVFDPTDAAIELFRSGDIEITENGNTTRIPRVLPFAHDGFGQDAEWVMANFTRLQELSPSLTNAEEILSVGYANWVDAQVGVGQLNGLYKFTASFEDAPPETTQLYIGDYSVCVTNAGDYVFLLEKGSDYEFGTWPHIDTVDYYARDDMSEGAPMLMSGRGGGESPGEWTIDGGWNLLYCPYIYRNVYYRGRCSWWPTLQGSPDVIHLGASDFPKLFSAMVFDYPDPDSLTFYWNTSDKNIHIDSPYSRQTMVSVDDLPSWNRFDLSVSTVINGYCLYSTIGSCSYGTNECPKVRLGLNVPKGIPLKGARLAADYSFECDVETNGWLVLECTSSTNRVSLWQRATNDVAFVCSNKIESASNCTASFYVYGENRSRSGQDVLLKLSFHSASGETNSVSATSTVFGCYCQPIMEARLPSGRTFYNPCSVKSGTDATFRADVVPSMSASNIVWQAVSGSVQLPVDVNGQMITVHGLSPGEATLGVTVLDYSDEKMKFDLEVVE